MTRDEALAAIGQKVRPTWVTTGAHWTLIAVGIGDLGIIRTNMGKTRAEPLRTLALTRKAAARMEKRK